MADHEKEKTRIPQRLKPGDTVGIVAPAGPFDRDIFERGLVVLQTMGFRIFVPEKLLQQKGYLAGSDAHRAGMINNLFADQRIQAIVCARGGFGSIRTLPLLDFELIRMNPKIFVGFSDVSALLSALFTKCQMVTFHGPVVTTLADAPDKTKEVFLAAVASDRKIEIQLTSGKTIHPGCVSGTVCGGNLATLCHLVGTSYAPSFTNKILFLEDRGEETYRIDRMLFQMKLAGYFDSLAGVILGAFTDCGPVENIYKVVGNIFQDNDIPILAGLDAGHGKHNITIPLGIEATLDADKKWLSYQRAATIGNSKEKPS